MKLNNFAYSQIWDIGSWLKVEIWTIYQSVSINSAKKVIKGYSSAVMRKITVFFAGISPTLHFAKLTQLNKVVVSKPTKGR